MKHKTKKSWLFTVAVLALLFTLPIKAQTNIGNHNPPKQFSILELNASSKGLRLPHLTTTQRTSISDEWKVKPDPDKLKGLVVYNINTHCMDFWNGSEWISLCSTVLERSEKPTVDLRSRYTSFCGNADYHAAYGYGVEGSKITVTWCDGSTDETIVGDNTFTDKSIWEIDVTRINPNYNHSISPYYGSPPCWISGARVEVVQTTPGKLPSEKLIFIIVDCDIVY